MQNIDVVIHNLPNAVRQHFEAALWVLTIISKSLVSSEIIKLQGSADSLRLCKSCRGTWGISCLEKSEEKAHRRVGAW